MQVILRPLPADFYKDLPEEDQIAIRSMEGQYVEFVDVCEDDKIEVEFTVGDAGHTIWIDPVYVALLPERMI